MHPFMHIYCLPTRHSHAQTTRIAYEAYIVAAPRAPRQSNHSTAEPQSTIMMNLPSPSSGSSHHAALRQRLFRSQATVDVEILP
jgi:hypothetical protein